MEDSSILDKNNVTAFASAFTTPGGELVEIKLQDFDTTFYVQKGLLCSASKYFDKALNGGFKDAATRSLTLPGCDKSTFEFLLFWMCRHELPEHCLIPCEDMDTNEANRIQNQLTRLWALADYLLMRQLQNMIIRQLIKLTAYFHINIEALEFARSATGTDSFLFRLYLMQAIDEFMDPKIQDRIDKMDKVPGLFAEIAVIIRHETCNPVTTLVSDAAWEDYCFDEQKLKD